VPLCVFEACFDRIKAYYYSKTDVYLLNDSSCIKEVIQMTKEEAIVELAEMAYANSITLQELAGEMVLMEIMEPDRERMYPEELYYLTTRRIKQ